MAKVDDVITFCLQRIDELVPATPIHWTRAEILGFVNDALYELNLIAWEFQLSVTDTVVDTENVYDCPDEILAPMSIRTGSKYLLRETVTDLDREAQWELASRKRMNISTWAPLGLNKYVIDPKPLASTSVYIEGLVEHTPVTDTAMDLPIRPEYDNAIQDYVIERAMFKEGGAELAQQNILYKDFIETAQQLSGRNIAKMFPRFTYGVVGDTALREKVEIKGGSGGD
jgi:hypothetical protein